MTQVFARGIIRGYQEQMGDRHVALLSKRFVTCDCSETGVGKTVAILSAVPKLGASFVVVCPKSVITHWWLWVTRLELTAFCLGVIGWEAAKLGCHPEIFDPRLGWFPRDRILIRRLIISDEAHRAKNYKTKNSKMVQRARESGHYLALLSATLIQSPIDLSGLAYPMGLIENQRYWFAFARQYGAGLNQWNGYISKASRRQLESLSLLLDKIRVRVRKSEVAPTMCLTQADLIDVEEPEKITRLYRQLKDEVAELEEKGEKAAVILVARLRGRQAVELEKVPAFVEETRRHLEEGAKVAIFFNFNRSIEVAREAFLEAKIPCGLITGEVSQTDRERDIAAFNDADLDVLLLNVAAGGEGISLHDANGNKPRVALLSPPESAGVLVQALGRIDRVGARSVGLNRILFVGGTIEETVFDHVTRKLDNLSLLNDGDLNPL